MDEGVRNCRGSCAVNGAIFYTHKDLKMSLKEKEEMGLVSKVPRARHNKTGNVYMILKVGAIDRTNSRDGTRVVVYAPDDNENSISVREEVEFFDNFSEMDIFGGAEDTRGSNEKNEPT